METCVLIPQEFALTLTASGAKHSREQIVSVWSTNRIPQGTVYYPFQGTVRIDKLEVYSSTDEEDVSYRKYVIDNLNLFIKKFNLLHNCQHIILAVGPKIYSNSLLETFCEICKNCNRFKKIIFADLIIKKLCKIVENL